MNYGFSSENYQLINNLINMSTNLEWIAMLNVNLNNL